MDKVTALRAFTRVAEAGSFAQAAISMNMPRSTVSKAIQELETHLGIKLIERTTRSVKISPEGVAYYERAIRLLADLDDMDSEVVRGSFAPKGKLRINMGAYFANNIVIPRLAEFQSLYPEIEFHLGVTERHPDIIEEGIDGVIRAGDLPDMSLVARKLCGISWVACASPSYIKARGMPETPQAIEDNHSVVQYCSPRYSTPYGFLFCRGDERVGFLGNPSLTVTDATAVLHSVIAGFGIAQMPAFIARPYIDSGSLVELLPDWHRPPRPVHLIRPTGRYPSLKVRVFSDWLATIFAPYDADAPKAPPSSMSMDSHSRS